jgi:hypothetical protein
MLRGFCYGGKGNGHGLDSIVYRKAGFCTDIYYMYTYVEVKNVERKKPRMGQNVE